jgi:thiol-disulfide isomerase/thioredoxin
MKPIYTLAAVLIVVLGAGILYLFNAPSPTIGNMPILGQQKYKEIVNPSGFVNSGPITMAELVGKKVILIDFLTYSCINCQRTFPYINAWYDKYKEYGLEVIGIHTPEFAFEKDIGNVRVAMEKFGITHPIVLDNNYATWNAYGNSYWPRKYLVDINGNIVYDHIGEGGYEETESKIRELLTERARSLGLPVPSFDEFASEAIPEVTLGTQSPETYFGASRNNNFGSGVPGILGEQKFSEPQTVKPNTLYLIGAWNLSKEYAETSSTVGTGGTGSDRVNFLYSAKSVYFVAGASRSIEMEVLLDSAPVPESKKGADVYYRNGKSYVVIEKNQLYKIIEGDTSEKHLLEFIISSPGLQAFTFTFG